MKQADGTAHVYFILAEPSHRVKIGWAIDPHKRLKQLQTGSYEKLKLLGSIKKQSSELARQFEADLHVRFKDVRIDTTEWFYPHPTLFSHLQTIGLLKHIDEHGESIKPPDSSTDLLERDLKTANNLYKLLLKYSDDATEDTQVREYLEYTAKEFYESDSTTMSFHMGCANYSTRHVLYLIWRVGCHLCRGNWDNGIALFLLEQAVMELKKEIARYEKNRA